MARNSKAMSSAMMEPVNPNKERPLRPKVMDHMEIHPNMQTGHNVEAHFTHYSHDKETKEFSGPHGKVTLPKGHILAHMAKHMGIPVAHAPGEDQVEAAEGRPGADNEGEDNEESME